MAGPKSNPATEFSAYLAKVLNGKNVGGIDRWKKNWAGRKGETADVAGLSPTGKARVPVEVERLREDPASNVVKIWDWIERGLVPRDVIFIHAFSRAYIDRKRSRRERAEFAGRRLRKEFRHATYEQISFAWNPKSGAKGIGGAAKETRRPFGKENHRTCQKSRLTITPFDFITMSAPRPE